MLPCTAHSRVVYYLLYPSDETDTLPMTLRTTLAVLLGLLATTTPARAQSVVPPESTHVEVGAMFWKPDPTIVIRSGSLSTDVDFIGDLGIQNERFREIRITLKPALKHKVRFAYIPVRYSEEGNVLSRTIVFRGVTYAVNLPVNAVMNWDFYRIGYEWDAVSGRRGYLGLLIDLKYNKVDAQLASPVGNESTTQTVPVPTIGGIARVYLSDYVSVTGEFTGFKFTRADSRGAFYDLDVFGQLNLTTGLAAQLGYRKVQVNYGVDDDSGDLKLEGLYFGGVIRF